MKGLVSTIDDRPQGDTAASRFFSLCALEWAAFPSLVRAFMLLRLQSLRPGEHHPRRKIA
jgi:hypothetical protein